MQPDHRPTPANTRTTSVLIAAAILLAALVFSASIASNASAASLIAGGNVHTCALQSGVAKCWGYNFYGQLGDGTNNQSSTPVTVSGLGAGVTAIAGGGANTCAIVNGGVFCWGRNNDGQLGNGTGDPYSYTPVPVTGLDSGVTALAVGDTGACVIQNGAVKCWGSDYYGELGNGAPLAFSNTPVSIPSLASGVTSITAGGSHFCAIQSGAAKCWGQGLQGQLGQGSKSNSNVPIDVTGLGSDVTLIDAGGNGHTCATQSGVLKCWGKNEDSQLGIGTTVTTTTPGTVTEFTGGFDELSLGAEHTCARQGTTIRCWGNNTAGQLGGGAPSSTYAPVPTLLTSGVTAIAAANNFTCAVQSGAAKCSGINDNGQLGNGGTSNSPTPTTVLGGLDSGVTAIATNGVNGCAIKSGAAYCWGGNLSGQLGNGTSGPTPATTPVPVTGLASNVTAISVGGGHACAIQNGAAKCWGFNFYGALGNADNANSSTPVDVSGLGSNVTAITAGVSHSCAVQSGVAKCWGYGLDGQLGNGLSSHSNVPVNVSTLGSGVTAIGAGRKHACAVENGAAKCWGSDDNGQIGDGGAFAASNTPVSVSGMGSGVGALSLSVGENHSCALQSGAAKCWGRSGDGQLGDGLVTVTGAPVSVVGLASGVSALAAGWTHSCALVSGATQCWGSNRRGQLGNGAAGYSTEPISVVGFNPPPVVPLPLTPQPVAVKPKLAKYKKARVKRGYVLFKVRASFAAPAGFARTQSCTGKVSARIKPRGVKRTAKSSGRLRARGNTCATTLSFKLPKRFKGKRVAVRLSFAGNTAVLKFGRTLKYKIR